MHVVICSIELFIPGAGSLKGKRHIIQSIIQRIRSRTNASVAETDFQDYWQRAAIGAAMVSSNKVLLEKQVNLLRDIVDNCAEAETVEFVIEFL